MIQVERPGNVPGMALDDAHQRHLLEDLLALKKEQGFGTQFMIMRAQDDCYDRFIIKAPLADGAVVVVGVVFSEYPAMNRIQLASKGDPQSEAVIEEISRVLQDYRGLVRLQDIARLVYKIAGKQQQGRKCVGPAEGDQGMSGAVLLSAPARSDQREMTEAAYLAFNAWGLAWLASLASVLLVGFLLEYLLGILKMLLSWLEGELLPGDAARPSALLASASMPTPRVDVPTLCPDAEKSPVMGTRTVEKLFIPERLVQRILSDSAQHAPNEYAFLCSGILTPEGTGMVTDYYPGEMEISTPVSCRLTSAFIADALYHQIPNSHQLVVWGHIHPIEGPSSTDTAAFKLLAQWDHETADVRGLSKKSLALLINGCTDHLLFYDVHSTRLIAHALIAPGGGASYGGPY